MKEISNNWFNTYKDGLKTESHHIINGQDFISPPIDKQNFYQSINQLLKNSDQPIATAFNFTIENSKLYSGSSLEGKDKNEAYQSAIELTEIIDNFTNNPNQINKFLTPKKELSLQDIAKSINRGFEAARMCQACEQVDSIVGAEIHVASSILAKVFNPTESFSEFWNETYPNSIQELNNPKTVGIVDVLIKTVQSNPQQYPSLNKFFNSHLDLPESDFSGTYYDMIDMPQYQNDNR